MEAQLVAEKSAKIRDWVSHKVQEVIASNHRWRYIGLCASNFCIWMDSCFLGFVVKKCEPLTYQVLSDSLFIVAKVSLISFSIAAYRNGQVRKQKR